MPFLKNLFTSRPPRAGQPIETRLIGERIFLRVGDPLDWQAWKDLRSQSRAFLTPWEPTWPPDALTYDYFCRNLRRHWREWREGTGYAFLICATERVPELEIEAGAIIGGLALTEVQRGIAQKATLGYWMGQPYTNSGYMTEAVLLACRFALDDLKLNRVEAACLPHNEPSKRLLEKTGFILEGRAKRYLRINGKWEDHLLWGRTAE
jgi:ribosomal-protein-alanine N-acetyltransferase